MQTSQAGKSIHNSGAFTLIEVIVIVFIISIILSAVLPSFQTISMRSIDSDARMVASVIRYCKDMAEHTRREMEMIINIDSRVISYQDEDKEVSKEIASLNAVKLTSSDVETSGVVKVMFLPSGITERVMVRLLKGSESLDIVYNPFSGRITVETGGSALKG